MVMSLRQGLLLSVLLSAVATEVRAQQPPLPADRPGKFVPKQPESRADLDRRDAHKLYAMGLLRQRQDRLVDAVRYLEEARQLDPDAAPIHKALVPLYLALGRHDDALTACRKALDQDPGDYETWYLYSRQLREQGRPRESLDALTRGIACPEVKEHLEVLVQMNYDQGTLSEEAKDWAKAETAYRAVIDILVDRRPALLESGPFNLEQLDGEAAKTQEHIGQVCIKAGKYDAAIKAFTAAQKLNPEQAGRLNYNLAEVCMARTKPGEALPYLDAYLKTQPQGTQPYEMKIDILKQLKRENEILPALKQYAERDMFNVALQMLVARQYGRERQWAEAERRYLKLAETTASSDVYRGLFDLYKEQAKETSGRGMAKALTQFDQAVSAATPKEEGAAGDAAAAAKARAMLSVIREDPDLIKGMLQEAAAAPRLRQGRSHSTWRLLAALATRGRQWDMAERLYKDCLDGVTPQNEGEVYGGLLDVLSEARKYEEVIKYCKEGLKTAQATNRVLFYAKLMVAHMQLNQADDALAAADEAVKLADDHNRLHVQRMRINVLSELGRHEQAVKECQALLKEAKQASEIRDLRYSLSGVYSGAKDYAKSEEQLRLILDTDPNDATANNDLGYIMADQGKNLEESEKLIRKAIDLDREEKKSGTEVRSEGDGDNAAYLDSLGWVLFRRGQLAEARDWLDKATSLPGGSDDPVVWDHLGDVCARQKEPAKARAAWEKAVQLYEQDKRRKPDDRYKEVKQKLMEVKN
jgi:tetratricopeptide (TPR) repeat protein